jgi:hypothetical protein
MKARFILVMLGMAALAVLSIGLQAQEKGVVPDKDDLITSEQQLARQFAEFQDALLRLKQRLARGTPEEKKRAETLDKVLDLCKELAINQEFTKMIEVLRTANLKNTSEIEKTSALSDSLSSRLARVLNMLRDSNVDELSKQRRDLKDIIDKLDKNIFEQRQVQELTRRDKTDPKDLKNDQAATTQNTSKIGKAIEKYLDPKGTEAKNAKGEVKDAGKNKGQAGETKDAGNQKPGATGETKDAGKDSKGAKGEAKAGGKGGEPKSGDQDPKASTKAGEKSGADPKEAGAKGEQKGQQGQEGASKESKGDPKSGQEGASKGAGGKAGDPKEGQQGAAKGGDDKKAGGDKSGSPSQSKAGGEQAPAGAKEVKGGDAKGGDAKGGDAKASPGGDPKAGDGKAGDSKDGQGQAKGGGSKGGGDPMGGSPPQAGAKGDGQSPPPGSPKSGDKDDVANAKKRVEEAGYEQSKAEGNLDKKDNPAAVKNQADTIKQLEAAKKKLENLLRQMREEEIERVLAALQARCEKMLMMQKQVLAGTEDLDRVINKNADKKPTAINKREGLKLSDQEKEIVQEANKCIDILEAEGSAVAFPEVFQQIRQDMIHVQKRLELTDSGALTQNIERDIIENLEEMIAALKKARQDNQDPPKSGKPGKSGPPGDQKLLELIQELKMVRSLQKRVNDRTRTYGKLFPNEEQARDPQIVRELRSLSERQDRIREIVSRIAKGDNK